MDGVTVNIRDQSQTNIREREKILCETALVVARNHERSLFCDETS